MAGETTWEPMRAIHSTDPVTVTNYGIGKKLYRTKM